MGAKLIQGKPLIEKTDQEKKMEAIENVSNKIDDLSNKMEYLFEKQQKQMDMVASKSMNQRTEQKMLFAVAQHEKVKQACMDRSNLEFEEGDEEEKELSEKDLKRLQTIDLLRQRCEVAELRYKQEMDHIEFSFEFYEFLKLYSGDTGDLGINFWKALL